MKKKWINLSSLAVIVMALSFFMVSCEKEDAMLSDDMASTKGTVVIYNDNYEPPTPSVAPEKWETDQGGNVTCEQVAEYYDTQFDYSTGRFNWEDGKFKFEGEEVAWPDGLTVTVINDTYVSFSLTDPFKIDDKCYLVGAVIVKGSDAANVYYYADGTASDEGLRSPLNKGGQQSELSNLTFCFIEVPCEDVCWEFIDETAWAADGCVDDDGNIPTEIQRRYTNRGNWATFYEYEPGKNASLLAGQNIHVGWVKFNTIQNDPDNIEIEIYLKRPWVFAPVEENIKVQDYAKAPSGNPSPGLFEHKTTADSPPPGTTVDYPLMHSIIVPKNNFYGVHVDVGYWEEVECPIEE